VAVSEPTGAAQRYKQIVAELDDAARTVQERDRDRAGRLAPLAAQSHDELVRSGERAALTRAGVELRWEAVVEALWAERWFLLRPPPEPDRNAHPDNLAALDRAVEEAYEAVLAAIRRRRLSFRRS
jgi:hypothetical protein